MTRPLVALAAIAAGLGACSDIRLEFPDTQVDPTIVDNELTISGQFCTSPAGNVSYPLKVLFIVDGSGSQQFADQNRQRVVAVERAINALIGLPSTFFKIVVFNASVTATPATTDPDVFTNDMTVLLNGLANVAEADTVTDYQGALSVAYNELSRDMQGIYGDPSRGPAELSRTKYVVIMMSDGFPDPQCQAGLGNDFDPFGAIDPLCENSDYIACVMRAGVCSNGQLCNASFACPSGAGACSGAPSCFVDADGYTVCDVNGTLCYAPTDSSTLLGGLANLELIAGSDYNQPYQILQKVEDIMDLEERYQVGELRFHSALVLDPLADAGVIAIFGDPTQAVPLMREMAEIGSGQYLEFYGGDEIDFLSLNFDTIKQQRVVRGFFADNMAARFSATELLPDSDLDGLVDDEETSTVRTRRRVSDTDGDGYNDYLEHKLRGFGYDALEPCKPARNDVPGNTTVCVDGQLDTSFNCSFVIVNGRRLYDDSDFDGLHDCEEEAVGTSADSPDSDADGMPDRLDFGLGLDALDWDYDRDADQDGLSNGREVEWHLNPLVPQADRVQRQRYRYDRPETGTTVDGRTCYDFDVRRVQLAATDMNEDLPPTLQLVGMNEVRVYILENMSDNLSGTPLVRVACLRPRYVPPSLKVPLSGDWLLAESDFHYLFTKDPLFDDPSFQGELFDPSLHCITAQ